MEPAGGLSGKKILVVDDDPNVIKVISESLKNESCFLDKAVDGLEAFEKIASEDYDLILSDVVMPGLNGQKLYKYINEVKPYLIHRCILITGVMNDQVEAFCKSAGLSYLRKPFSSQELKKIIVSVFHKEEKKTSTL